MLGADDATTLVHDRRVRSATLAVHDWGGDGRADAARAPHRLPRPGLGAGRRAARRGRAGACGRSTSAATATATRPTRPATRTRGRASRPTRSPSSTTSASPAIPALVACGHSKGAAALLLGEARPARARTRASGRTSRSSSRRRAPSPADDFPLATSARRRRNEWASVDEAYDAYASKPPLNVMTPESLRAYVDYGLRDRGDGVFELKCRPEVEARVYAMAPANGAWAMLPRVDVAGRGRVRRGVDRHRPAARARRSPSGCRTARLEVWPGCGHFGPQQDPDRCASSISRFAGS